ncbi:MAG: hypothetical protein AAB425_07905, partial [Bdellovibrionota bacterium]
EQRLAISQIMGLIIATSISEMEECLERLRDSCWTQIHHEFPVSPEFVELGEQFFEEEIKHSRMFRRYFQKFAETCGIDPDELRSTLPVVEGTLTEKFLATYTKLGGYTFWWIVAQAEQVFLQIYHSLRPCADILEPLYYDLHRKHFEEEARHAHFPYLMLALMSSRGHGMYSPMHVRADFAIAELVQTAWTVTSMARTRRIQGLKSKHPLFGALASVYPLLEKEPLPRILWRLVTSTPYVSGLANPSGHKKILSFAREIGAYSVPYPLTETTKVVKY